MSGTKPLRIELRGRGLYFSGLDDLRFALESRIDVPLSKVRDLERRPAEEIHRQAVDIRKVEHLLIEILGNTFGEPLGIDHRLRQLDRRMFSEDHGWREIIGALANLSSDYADYKRLALLEYLNYLGARQGILGELHAANSGNAEAEATPDRMGETTVFMAPSAASPSPPPSPLLPETTGDDYVRLQRCVPVSLTLPVGHEMRVKLSSHPFRLVHDKGLALVDEFGVQARLRDGRTLVGRGQEMDVAVDPAFRSVSRKHLVIDALGDQLYLTDLSSLGTFAEVEYVGGV